MAVIGQKRLILKRLAERSVRFTNCYAGSFFLPWYAGTQRIADREITLSASQPGDLLRLFDDSMPQILKDNGVYSHLISDHIHYWEDGGATYHYRYNSWEIIRGQEGDKWKCLPELLGPCDESKLQNKDGLYFQATQDLQRLDAVNRKFVRNEEDTSLGPNG